jgi:hypothetical protein
VLIETKWKEKDDGLLCLQVFHATLQVVQGVLAAAAREVGQFVQALLTLAYVPVQTLGQRIEPIGDLVLGTNTGHRVDRCGNSEAEEDTLKSQFPILAVRLTCLREATLGDFGRRTTPTTCCGCLGKWKFSAPHRPARQLVGNSTNAGRSASP